MTSKNLFRAFKQSAGIEHHLFRICLILTIAVFAFWSAFAFLADYNLPIKLIYLAGLFIYSGLYLAYGKGASFNIIATLYYSFAFLFIVMGWLPSGGVTGAVMQMFVLVFASGLLVLPTRAYLIFVIATLCVVGGFSIYEFLNPGAAAPYTTRTNEIRDLGVASFLMVAILGYALFLFKRSYMQDRSRLSKAIRDLAEAKHAAESADKAKTKFLATISHEMRTPLNGIIGLTELLGKTELSSEQKEMLGSLTYSSDLLHSLISDVLDLSLIADDKLVLQKNEIDIEGEIGDILEIFRRRLESKSGNVALSYDHDREIPRNVFNDITRFRQILINLINNAIKFTVEGYVVVKSEMKELNEKSALIEFSVSDTGSGIPEEKQPYVFEKFYKATDNQTVEGSGLGLSICKNLVEAMGGKINFETEERVGTIFYFELPFELGVKKVKEEVDEASKGGSYSHMNVLVAEDVKINQMVITKMLRNMGISTFDVVENGELAVQKADEKAYDFILMDVQMPKKNGIEASREILEKIKSGQKPPVIVAVTANVMSGEKEECKNAGMSDFISKPITSEMLKEVFDRYM